MNIFIKLIYLSITTSCIAKITINDNNSMAQTDLQKVSFRVNLERH